MKKILILALFLTANAFASDYLGDYVRDRDQRYIQNEYARQEADATQQMAQMEANQMRSQAWSN
jgi:uncharacterized protein YxeA